MSTPDTIPESVAGRPKQFESLAACLLALAALGWAVAGWRIFWFYTDDAFISFRYASNWMAGLGPVWNPPPFQPVEGYTNFLWMALLTFVWKAFGVAPPDSANILLLGMGLATVARFAHWMWKILSDEPPASRLFLFAAALALLVSNRTFLTWMSSGLETMLFAMLFLLWCYALLEGLSGRQPGAAFLGVCATATGMVLTRPDGLVFWGLTAILSVATWRSGKISRRRFAAGAFLLAPVLVHFLWRRFYYGDWLPNTYYAKVLGAWPAMGFRYLASFLLEYAWYVPLAVVLVEALRRRGMFAKAVPAGCRLIAAGIGVEIAYYTIRVGGDHFEYRVLNHLIPVGIAGFFALLVRLKWPAPAARAVVLLWLGMSLVLPWTHWAMTNDLLTRKETQNLWEPVAPVLPMVLQPVARPFDALQKELIAHSVCIRHQEHKVFYLSQVATYPTRDAGSRYPWTERNIFATPAVGVPAWVFPGVAIIDTAGLNDRVLAHAPVPPAQDRHMAHERLASQTYVSCYLPNLAIEPAEFSKMVNSQFRPLPEKPSPGFFDIRMEFAKRRNPPALDGRIRDCESRNWAAADLLVPQ